MRPYPSSFLFNCPICIVLLHTLQQTDKPMLDIVSYNHYNESSVIHFRVWRSLVSRLVRVQETVGSNPATRTTSSRTAYRSRRRFLFPSKRHRSFTPSLLLSKPQPLCWVAVWVPPCGRLLSQSSSTSFLPTQDKTRGATKVVPLVLGSLRPGVGAGFRAAQKFGLPWAAPAL